MTTTYIEAAERLLRAYRSGPVQPLRDVLAPQDAEGAYAVQSMSVGAWLSEGRRVVGRKIGLTSLAVQNQLGVNQPDFGVLFADMRLEDGGTLAASQVLQPKAEAEIAFILRDDLNDADVTSERVASAIETAMAAIEIVDSRIADWKITFADTVADNGSSAFFVQSSERKSLKGLDLWSCGMVLEKNGNVVSTGAGAACLGHPLNAATWLARTLAMRGEGLRAGDVLLTGALGPMVTLAPGDVMRATVGGLGTVGFRYVSDR
jgi:2-keto-4-pentenoate hydratase